MREIKSGDTILRIRASALTIFLFKQEFDTDILKTLSNILKDMAESGTRNGYEFLQVIWALNKTQNVAENIQTPNFEQWIEKHADITISDISRDVLEEAMQGFFRISTKGQSSAK